MSAASSGPSRLRRRPSSQAAWRRNRLPSLSPAPASSSLALLTTLLRPQGRDRNPRARQLSRSAPRDARARPLDKRRPRRRGSLGFDIAQGIPSPYRRERRLDDHESNGINTQGGGAGRWIPLRPRGPLLRRGAPPPPSANPGSSPAPISRRPTRSV